MAFNTKIVINSINMARQRNDGKGRIGGRDKGTPNKVTKNLRSWLAEVIDENRGQIIRDLATLEPRERLQILEKFMQYVTPKPQPTRISLDTEDFINEVFIAPWEKV